MSLAAVIERSKTDREAWRYTSLEAVEKTFEKILVADRQKRQGDPVLDTDKNQCRPQKDRMASSPVGARNKSHETPGPCLVFLNGIWQREKSRFQDLPSDLLRGSAEEGYCLTFDGQAGPLFLELLFPGEPEAAPFETKTKLRLVLKSDANLTLMERHIASNGAAPFAHLIEHEIILEPGARLTHGKMVPSSSNVHVATTRITVAREAFYDGFAVLGGGKPLRNEIEVTLAGEKAGCSLHGAMLGRDAEHADTTICVTHAAPHTSSRQLYKAVLGGSAHGVFQGKIKVEAGAQKTDGHQLCRAILLSGQAEMDAKPELEIYADDVKCSHGCSIGNLDGDALFYLRSRGIGETEARGLLIEAFLNEIVDDVPSSPIRAFARQEVAAWLSR